MTLNYLPVFYTVEVEIDDTGTVLRETWMNADGVPDRPGGLPAYTEYCPRTNAVQSMSWYKNGELHRDGGEPACIDIDPDTGVHTRTVYMTHGKQEDQGDTPAVVWRNTDGSLLQQTFMRSGKRHRENGPAHSEYDELTGQLIAEEFWVDGQRVEPF